MRHRTTFTFAFAALSFAAPEPAIAEPTWEARQSTALKWELGYLALTAIDTAQTIDCLNRDICSEGNPIFGKHPSSKKLILAKVGLGAVHFAIFNHINQRNPGAAMRIAQVSCAVQGGVVLLNARITFR
jgi:hypothetical protein